MAHTHDVYDTGKYFEINGISRFIKETSDTKLVLVQGDHNSEVITFQMPRYIDGHDMLLCNKIRVHYINLDTKTNDKSADIYEVTDLALCEECEEETLTFTWKIEAPATKYSGSLAFLIKFECTEGENILYQWNTAKYVGVNVLDGIDNGEEFVDKYSNVLEEWYNELTSGADSIEELNQQALAEIELAKEDAKEDIQGKADATMAEMNQFSSNAYNSFKNDVDTKAKQTLESIPEDYSDLDAELQDIRVGADGKTYPNAGEAVRAQFSQLSEEIEDAKNDVAVLDNAIFKTFVGNNILPPNIEWYENNGLNINTGNLLNLEGSWASGFIPVNEPKTYVFVSQTGSVVEIGGRVLGYDENKNYIGINAEADGYKINTQSEMKYIRFVCANESQKNSIVAIVPYIENSLNGYDVSFYGVKKEENYVRKDDILKNNDNIPSAIENNGDVITKFSDYTSTYKTGSGAIIEKTSDKTKRVDESVKVSLTSGSNMVKFYGVSLKSNVGDALGLFIYCFSDNISSLALSTNEQKIILSTSKIYLLRGWNYLAINTEETIDTRNIVLSINCSEDSVIFIDSIVKDYRLKPTILFSFDTLLDTDIFGSEANGYGSIYDVMTEFGFVGTVAFQSGGFPSSSSAPITRKKFYYDLKANGWDYGYYNGDCIDVARPVTVSDTPDDTAVYDKTRYSDWKNFINAYKDRLADNGYFDPISYFCRYNLTSTNITGVCMENGTKIVRMGCSEKIINHYDSESIELPVIHVTDSVNGNNIQFVKDKIDYVIANGKALGLMTHRLENLDNATKDSYCSTTAFREILAYIKEKVDVGELQVLTYEEFYKSFYQDDYEKLLVSRRAKKDCWLEEKLLAN